MNPNVLAILITVRNANAAVEQINGVTGALSGAAQQARLAMIAFRALAVATLFLFGTLKAAGEDESMRLQLTALTHSSSIALSQMQAIRQESEKGLFDKEQLFQARKVFDEVHASITDLLPLSEELALRSGKGLDATARIFASLESGGIARLGAVLRQAGLGIDALRGAGLDVTKSYQVKSSPQETLRVLRELLSKDSLTDALNNSLSSSAKGTMAALKDLFRSIGEGLLPFVKPALSLLEGLLKTLTLLNDITHGWIGNIVLAVGALKTISLVLPIIQSLVLWERLAAFWTGFLIVLNQPWRTIADAIYLVVAATRALITVEALAAVWEAIRAALTRNWVGLAVAGAIAAGAGIAWYGANHSSKNEESVSPAERPTRRSDIESQQQRMRARAWA